MGFDARLLEGLRPATQHLYRRALYEFWCFLSEEELDPVYNYEVDRTLVYFMERRKWTPAKLQHLLAALEKVAPHFKWRLPWAHARVLQLAKKVGVNHTLPMPWPAAIAVAYWIAMQGFARVGALILLQWCTGLRPGELTDLEGHHLTRRVPDGSHARPESRAYVTLGVRHGTKARRAQFVTIDPTVMPTAIFIIESFIRSTPRGTRLTSATSTTEMYHWIQKASRALSLPAFTAHSPRAGWATFCRLEGYSSQYMMQEGRWENEKSMKQYLDAVTVTDLLHTLNHILPFSNYVAADMRHRFPWKF